MSVYDHPNKPGWQMIKISHGRKGKPEYISYPGSREHAQMYEKELRGITDTTDPVFTDKLPDFKLAYKNEVQDGTYTDFTWALKQLEPFFGKMKIRHITATVIELYKNHRREQTVKTTGKQISKRTVNRELSYLSKYMTYCGSTLKIIKFRKKDCEPAPPEIINMATMVTIIKSLNAPIKYLVQLMAFNGLRKSEAFNLKSSDASADGTTLKVWGKGGKWRRAPVEDPELQEAIKAAKTKDPDGYLFPNPRTKLPYTDIRKTLRPAGKAAGVEHIYNHLMRHSFATDMAGEDENVFVLQNLLGHADIKMTQKYVHLADKTMRRATARMVERKGANVAIP